MHNYKNIFWVDTNIDVIYMTIIAQRAENGAKFLYFTKIMSVLIIMLDYNKFRLI